MKKRLRARPVRQTGRPDRPRERRKYLTQRDKTLRAYRSYLDLLDTADWFRGEMRGQLETFGLTMGEFRVLEMIHREGPTYPSAAAREMQRKRQNVDAIVEGLIERGWVRREVGALPPVDNEANRTAKARGHQRWDGRRVALLCLTPSGRKFIGSVFPKHAKVVKSWMRVLNSRQQKTLSGLLRLLRENDIMKFVREIRMRDEEEEIES